ncbi:MAG TPA: hypothetical protein VN776_12825 [Terracidiphilus sp.]|nr:hypothetical protein [Terracidiphilus sp.]
MTRRFALLAALACLAACSLSAQTSAQTPAQAPAKADLKADPWAGLRFLIGSWEAKTTGGVAQVQASATYSFRLELRDHVLARQSNNGACSGPDDFDCRHSDLLYIYPGANGQTMQAIYFDNEGHVLHYDVSTPRPGAAVFVSDATQPGPQFRLTYELLDGVMTGKFELKTPGQADFMSYLEWSGKRR